MEEQRAKFGKLIDDEARWSSICAFWLGMDQSSRQGMSQVKAEPILKAIVEHFFQEKEVMSTLVVDSLYTGIKALERQDNEKESKRKYLEAGELPAPIVRMKNNEFVLVDDVLILLERSALSPKNENGPLDRKEARSMIYGYLSLANMGLLERNYAKMQLKVLRGGLLNMVVVLLRYLPWPIFWEKLKLHMRMIFF